MEGIRRIGAALKGLGAIWLLAFIVSAAFQAVGSDTPMTYQEQEAIYQRDTGRSLETDAEAHMPWLNGRPHDPLERMAAATDERDHLLAAHFAGRPTTIRRHDFGSAQACLIVGFIGFAILTTLGWIVSGFAVRRI